MVAKILGKPLVITGIASNEENEARSQEADKKRV
jgi:hypothetical protein